MRYYFDIKVHGVSTRDEVGEEFPSFAKMVAEAKRALTTIFAHEFSLEDKQECNVSVRDGERCVYSLAMTLNGVVIFAPGLPGAAA